MKLAIEQLCEDVTIVYCALHALETFSEEDPLRPELSELLIYGTTALVGHLVTLREQVQKYRCQYLLTPYARVRTHYLALPSHSFSLDREAVGVMSSQELVVFLLTELQSSIQNKANYTSCLTFERCVLIRLRQLYQMTGPRRCRKRKD